MKEINNKIDILNDSSCINLCHRGEGGNKVLISRHNAAINQWNNPEMRKKISETKKKQCVDLKYRKKSSNILKESHNRKYYNNDVLQAYIKEKDIPEGFVSGKYNDSVEYKRLKKHQEVI